MLDILYSQISDHSRQVFSGWKNVIQHLHTQEFSLIKQCPCLWVEELREPWEPQHPSSGISPAFWPEMPANPTHLPFGQKAVAEQQTTNACMSMFQLEAICSYIQPNVTRMLFLSHTLYTILVSILTTFDQPLMSSGMCTNSYTQMSFFFSPVCSPGSDPLSTAPHLGSDTTPSCSFPSGSPQFGTPLSRELCPSSAPVCSALHTHSPCS